MPVFQTKRRIEFCDTDMAGIVHFSNFFRYMEAAECELLRTRGLSVKLEWEGQVDRLPARVGVLRLREARPASRTCSISRSASSASATKSVTFAFEFTLAASRIAQGKGDVGLLPGRTRITGWRASRFPASYRARLASPIAPALARVSIARGLLK